jgi:HlyD family secretion protein
MKVLSKSLLVVALAAAAGGGWYWYRGKSVDGDEIRYRMAKVERGAITAAISAEGTLNAVSTVQVAAQISGQVKEIFADFKSAVKKDQVIARIDPAAYEQRVNQARVDVDAARGAVAAARSAAAATQGELLRARSAQLDAQREFDRKKPLAEKNFISAAELERSRAALDGAREQLKAAEARLRENQAQAAGALAAARQRESLLRQAEADLERTVVRAPVDGTVILRNVDAGQMVAANGQAPVLFAIAQDLRDMQVEIAVDEAGAEQLRAGLPASFSVDAFPRRSFSGEIRQVRRSPAGAQSEPRYTVAISVANPDLALLPGMTARVRVVLDGRDGVLKLPNAALRFRPAGARQAKPAEASSARVWTLLEGELMPLEVRLGLTDGAFTELLGGPLAQGDEVIVGVGRFTSSSTSAGAAH